MKEIFFTLFLALLAISNATAASPYDFSAVCPSGHKLFYKITDVNNKTVELTYETNITTQRKPHYSSAPTGNIDIPSTVSNAGNTYKVTSIGANCFEYCSQITAVSIPNTVIKIGDSAFFSDNMLTSISIPNSVVNIDTYAFSDCLNLATITIGNSVENIANLAFYNCAHKAKFYCKPLSVPSISGDTFQKTDSFDIYVSCDALQNYKSADNWKNLRGEFIVAEFYNLDCKSESEEKGTVTSDGCVTFSALPKTGYQFAQWSDGNADNPRIFVLTNDVTVTAQFEKSTAIDNVNSDNQQRVYVNGSRIVVDNTVAEVINVYSINGQLVDSKRNNRESKVEFDVSLNGIYLVKTDKSVTKVVVRK